MSAPYLNPIDLFDLAATPREELTFGLLKKHKRRFIAELEIDDFDEFEVAGTSFVSSDLERAVDELKVPGFLEAQHFSARHPGVVDFLTNGLIPYDEDVNLFGEPALRPVIERYFAATFNPAFLRAGLAGDHEILAGLNHLAGQTTIPPARLYDDTYRYVSRETDRIAGAVKSLLAGNDNEDTRAFLRGDLPEKVLPVTMMNNLPEYFSDQINRLAAALLKFAKKHFQNREGRFKTLVEYMADLPHLNPNNNKTISAFFKVTNDAAREAFFEEIMPDYRAEQKKEIPPLLIYFFILVIFLCVKSCF